MSSRTASAGPGFGTAPEELTESAKGECDADKSAAATKSIFRIVISLPFRSCSTF